MSGIDLNQELSVVYFGAGMSALQLARVSADECEQGFILYRSPHAGDTVENFLGVVEPQGIDLEAEIEGLNFLLSIKDDVDFIEQMTIIYYRESPMSIEETVFPIFHDTAKLLDESEVPEHVKESSGCKHGIQFETLVVHPHKYKAWLEKQVFNHPNCKGVIDERITDLDEAIARHNNCDNFVVALGSGARHIGEEVILTEGITVVVDAPNFPKGKVLSVKVGDQSRNCYRRSHEETDEESNEVVIGCSRRRRSKPQEADPEEAQQMYEDACKAFPEEMKDSKILRFLPPCYRPGSPLGFIANNRLRHDGKYIFYVNGLNGWGVTGWKLVVNCAHMLRNRIKQLAKKLRRH